MPAKGVHVSSSKKVVSSSNKQEGMPVFRPPQYLEDLVYAIAQKFFEDPNANKVADWVNGILEQRGDPRRLTRQQVYPVVKEAIRRKYVIFNPPLEHALATNIALYTKTTAERINVVKTYGPEGTDHLASSAASMMIELIKQVARGKGGGRKKRVPVHLGLGSGYTTLQLAKHLGVQLSRLTEIEGVSRLVFHALSSGFDVYEPQTSPVAFFSYFTDLVIPHEFIGLFSTAVVKARDYEMEKTLPGVRDAFKHRDEIEIVVTSLAAVDDKKGLLNQLEHQYADSKPPRRQTGPRRVGDVQFRPYSEQGPIEDDPDGIRAVTLFELEDFVAMTRKKNRYVLIVAGTTHDGRSRAQPLLPLLREPSLKVWTHLCLDFATGREIVDAIARPASAGATATSESERPARRKPAPEKEAASES